MRFFSVCFTAIAVISGGVVGSYSVRQNEVRAKSFVLEDESGGVACRLHVVGAHVAIGLPQSGVRIAETGVGGMAITRLEKPSKSWLKFELTDGGAAVVVAGAEHIVSVGSGARVGSGLGVVGRDEGSGSLWVGESKGVIGLEMESEVGEKAVVAVDAQGSSVVLGKDNLQRRVGMYSKSDLTSISLEHGIGFASIKSAPDWKGADFVVASRGDVPDIIRMVAQPASTALALRSGGDKAVQFSAAGQEAMLEILNKDGVRVRSEVSGKSAKSWVEIDDVKKVEVSVDSEQGIEVRGLSGG